MTTVIESQHTRQSDCIKSPLVCKKKGGDNPQNINFTEETKYIFNKLSSSLQINSFSYQDDITVIILTAQIVHLRL